MPVLFLVTFSLTATTAPLSVGTLGYGPTLVSEVVLSDSITYSFTFVPYALQPTLYSYVA